MSHLHHLVLLVVKYQARVLLRRGIILQVVATQEGTDQGQQRADSEESSTFIAFLCYFQAPRHDFNFGAE